MDIKVATLLVISISKSILNNQSIFMVPLQ